jgi:hypothetical protein
MAHASPDLRSPIGFAVGMTISFASVPSTLIASAM